MFSGRQFITVLFSGRQCIKVVFSGRQWICGLRQPSWRRTQSRCRTTGPASPSVDQSENIRFLISNYLSIYLNRTLHACFSIHLWILIYLSINLDCFLLKKMTSFAVRPSVRRHWIYSYNSWDLEGDGDGRTIFHNFIIFANSERCSRKGRQTKLKVFLYFPNLEETAL